MIRAMHINQRPSKAVGIHRWVQEGACLAVAIALVTACGEEGDLASVPVQKATADQERPVNVADDSLALSKVQKQGTDAIPSSPSADDATAEGTTKPITAHTNSVASAALSLGAAMKAGREHAKRGALELAIKAFTEASAIRPKSARPHVEIATLLIGANTPTVAKEHALLAVKLAPDWSRAWNTLGRVELLQGKLKTAEKAFAQATQQNPQNIYAWNNLGLVRIKRQRYVEAVDALEHATASTDAKAYMFNNLGTAYERASRVDEALSAYKEGLMKGSGLAGKNFVRLEEAAGREQRALRSTNPGHPEDGLPDGQKELPTSKL